MKPSLRVFCVLLTAALALAIPPTEPTLARSDPPNLKIAVVNTVTRGVPPALVALAMRPLRAYMESQTGMSGEIVVGGDAFALGKKLDDDTFQIGVFHGHEFAWAKKKYPRLEPLVICLSGKVSNQAVQVVAAKSKVRVLADLKGGSLALPRENRGYCRLYAGRCCVPAGSTPEAFYKRITSPIDAEDALDAVTRGKIDSAIVEASSLDSYRKNKPAWAKYLRVLQESEIFPCGVIACRKDKFDAKQFDTLRAALINTPNHPQGKEVMTSMRVLGFSAAPENFQAILDACHKVYPPLDAGSK